MANDTRSGRKNNDEEGSSSKKKSVDIKGSSTSGPGRTNILDSRKAARETSCSPLSTRKSERLEKRTIVTPLTRQPETLVAPLTRKSETLVTPLKRKSETLVTPLKRKSERTETQNSPSALRRSERGKKDASSSSPGSKHPIEGSKSADVNKKKVPREKSLNQLTVESAIVEIGIKNDQELVGMKRITGNARNFKGKFRAQKKRITSPDIADKPASIDELPEVECNGSQGGAPQQMDLQSQDIAVKPERIDVVSEVECGSSQGGAPKKINLQSQCVECTTPTYDDKGVSSLSTQSPSPSGVCEDRRVKYESSNQACNVESNKDSNVNSCQKGKGDLEATIIQEFSKSLESSVQLEQASADVQLDAHKKVCVICNGDEELLICDGKGCENCYHLSCLDPPLDDFPPGFWHCICCVKKKFELGVHSVSKGVESIWDSREVEVSDSEGKNRQKQYFVKYQGLAHVHNQWVPETVLLSEVPSLVDKFSQEQQALRWNLEWTVPHRLLKKRLLSGWNEQSLDRIMDCQFEFLVKWCDLGYEHATWELENAHFLRSSLGQKLLREFEIRREKAKRAVDKSHKGLYVKLTKLPSGGSSMTDSNLLSNVNKLREMWYKCQNAAVLDDQDRVMSAIFFILSLSEIGCPFLVIATSEALPLWEAEFRRLAPSMDLVVYAGNKDTRRNIRALEFYEEGGQMMLQVLLSSLEASLEDLHILTQLSWGAILIDECHSRICTNDETMKMLATNSRVILFASQLKDTVSDYLSVLSLLDTRDLGKTGSLKCDSLNNLKESFSRFIAYSCKSESTKFVEYWVPVQISNLQLEQYCATLLSNSMSLRSSSKNDPVGVLHDILSSMRKCCDHPFLVDSALRGSIIEGLPLSESWGLEIRASGKLHFLDMILKEIKAKQLRVLILFQSIGGLGGMSTGDLLDDFVRQRFGQDCYERVDACIAPSRKQASLNRFNNKESDKFVFLLENRARLPSIKLSSVDTVIIFDNDWHPGNDLRALQKISIDSQVQPIKVFRLYSAFTFEENVLMHAKQGLKLENNLQNISRNNIHTLLIWGASYLFSRLDEFHASSNQMSPADISSGELLANDVLKEFLAILTGDSENNDADNSVISKMQHCMGVYGTNIPLLGERKIQSTIREEPHIFWRNLLEGRNPQWRYSCCPSSRNRKRVQYSNGSSRKPETESEDIAKKRRKVVNSGVDPSPTQIEPTAGTSQVTPVSQSLPASTAGGSGPSLLPEVDPDEPGSKEQKSLHAFLTEDMAKLCELLALSEDVKHMVERFMEYVIDNHRVTKEPANILQALQMSMCWIAASMLKQKMDKKATLMLAQQRLNFECTEELAEFVYVKLRELKKTFMQKPEVLNYLHSLKFSTPAGGNVTLEASDAKSPNQETVRLGNVKSEANQEPVPDKLLEIHRVWEDKRLQLEKKHRLDVAVIRSMYNVNSVRMFKLNKLDEELAKKLKELEQLKEAQLEDLKAKQSAATDEERQKAGKKLAEMKCRDIEPGTSGRVHMHASGSGSEVKTFIDEHTPKETRNDIRASDVTPSADAPDSDEAVGCTDPVETGNASKSLLSEVGVGEVTGVETHSKILSERNEAVVQYNEEGEVRGNIDTDMPDCLENQKDKAEFPSSDQSILKAPLVEATDTTDHGISVPTSQASIFEVPQCSMSPEAQDVENQPLHDKLPGSLMSTEMQDADQMDTANQNIPEAVVVPSEVADAGPTAESNNEANCGLLEPVIGNSSLGCLQSPTRQPQHACGEGEPEILHHVLPQTGEYTRIPSSTDVAIPITCDNQPDPQISVPREHRSGSSATSQEVGAPSHVNSFSNELLNHAVPRPGSHINDGQVPFDHPAPPTNQTDLRNPSLSTNADPLQNELERLRKEKDQVLKGHDDIKLRLRSDCQKEIEEAVTRIRKKYEAKLQDAEALFLPKKIELDTTLNKVFLNKILADAVRSKCLDLRPSGLSKQQVMPTSFMQQMHQLSSQPTMGPTFAAGVSSASRPPATLQNTISTVPPIQRSTAAASPASRPPANQQNAASSVPPSHRSFAAGASPASHPPATQQNTTSTAQLSHRLPTSGSSPATQWNTTSPVPASSRSATLSPGVLNRPHVNSITSANMRVGGEILPPGAPSRPSFIHAITPSNVPRVGREPRAPAPHLAPSRPSGSVPAISIGSLTHSMPNQHHVRPPSAPSLSRPPPLQSEPSKTPSTVLESPSCSMPSQQILTRSTPSLPSQQILTQSTPSLSSQQVLTRSTPSLSSQQVLTQSTPSLSSQQVLTQSTPSLSSQQVLTQSTPSLSSQQVLTQSTPSPSQLTPIQLSEPPATILESIPLSKPSQQVLTQSIPSLSQFTPAQLSEPPARLSSQAASSLPPHSQPNQLGSDISGSLSASRTTHPSAMELLMDVDRQSAARGISILPPLADDGSNFNTNDQSEFGTAGKEQDNATTSDVVCLSDDD